MIRANVGCILSYCFVTDLFVQNRSVRTILEHSRQIVHLGSAFFAEYGRCSARNMPGCFNIIKDSGGIEFYHFSGQAVT